MSKPTQKQVIAIKDRLIKELLDRVAALESELEGRAKVTVTDSKGNTQVFYGRSIAAQARAHKAGKCNALCSFCYEEACDMRHQDDSGS